MPYRYGHHFVAFTLLVILTGFWATYFAPFGRDMPLAFHVHAATSSTWLLLLIAQSVVIHRRMHALHRTLGLASFVLFPLLMLGFAMIINVSAERFAARESDFITALGPAFGLGMLVAMAAYLTLFYQALRQRRNVRLHAGYMLATPMILFESPFSRAMDQFFPWMNFIGSEGPRGLLDTIVVSNAMVTAFALFLYFRDRKHGAPWLVASAFMTLQSAVMWLSPEWSWAGDLFDLYARIPAPVSASLALLAGIAAGWFGWQAAPARKRKAPDVPVAETAS